LLLQWFFKGNLPPPVGIFSLAAIPFLPGYEFVEPVFRFSFLAYYLFKKDSYAKDQTLGFRVGIPTVKLDYVGRLIFNCFFIHIYR
jgi:hypothetical protein